jgi:hypothetical protein
MYKKWFQQAMWLFTPWDRDVLKVWSPQLMAYF